MGHDKCCCSYTMDTIPANQCAWLVLHGLWVCGMGNPDTMHASSPVKHRSQIKIYVLWERRSLLLHTVPGLSRCLVCRWATYACTLHRTPWPRVSHGLALAYAHNSPQTGRFL